MVYFDRTEMIVIIFVECLESLVELGLPREDLRQIWELSDMDRDGRLDRDEYAVALHLVTLALEGTPVPAALPHAMVPPSKRPS